MMASRRASVTSRLLREEEGAFLVEILVSAVILLTVALGVVAAFDTAGAQSSQQRAQAVASNLAASEIERLRSLRFSDLASQTGTRPPVTVGGTIFMIATDVGQTGTPAPAGGGCDTASRSAEAVRATTTVTWPSQRNQRPVRLTSLIAAPANATSLRGTVVAQVVTSEGFGVPGLSITLNGASSATATTDSAGCARFTDLVAATGYHLTFSRANWVDPLGRTAIDDTLDVVAGATQTKSYQYDQMGTATASFFSTSDGQSPTASNTVAAPQIAARWSHANMATPKTQTFAATAGPVTSPLMPAAASAYTVQGGTCSSSPPALFTGSAVVPNGTAQVRVPTIRVLVEGRGVANGNAMANAAGARVFVDSCDGRQQGTANASGSWTGGAPFSNAALSICADGTYNGSKFVGNGVVTPLAGNGIATVTVEIFKKTTAPLTC